MTTLLKYKGQTYPMLSLERLTPGEAAAVEGVTGMTFQRIRRLMASCVCDHDARTHMHDDDAAEDAADDSSCNECSCREFEADMPVAVSTALTWMAIKRVDRSVKYAEVAGTSYEDFDFVEDETDEGDEGELDPTQPPPAAA